MGCTWALPVMPYGNLWRTHRRLFHRFFNPSTATQFDDKIHRAINIFLHRLSESPERFLNHIRLCVCPHPILASSQAHYLCAFQLGSLTGSLVLSIAYGVEVKSESDRYFSASEHAMAAVDLALLPGAFLVDVFPMRMGSGQRVLLKRSHDIHFHSQVCPGMVSRSWFQDIREDRREGHRRFHYPSVPTR